LFESVGEKAKPCLLISTFCSSDERFDRRRSLYAMRPLSFLSEVEAAIRLMNADALPGDTTRAIDFRQGLARLQLTPAGDLVAVQCFELSDGRDCLKAVVRWAGTEETREVSVYPNETNRSTIWKMSAHRLAEMWLDGPPVSATATMEPTRRISSAVRASA
jgi:hypothetical protein